MQPNARCNTLKVPQSDAEDTRLRQFCGALGLQRAPFVRRAIDSAIKSHRSAARSQREWPRHGHVALCPGKGGSCVRPLRL